MLDLFASSGAAVEDRLVKRIRLDRGYASCSAHQSSVYVGKKRTSIPVSTNTAFEIDPELCFMSSPTGQEPLSIHPIIYGIADEIHDLLFCRSVAMLCQADQGNTNQIPAVPVCCILRCKKNIKFRAILLQNTLYLRGASVLGRGMPESSWYPPALESGIQGMRYLIPINRTPISPYIFADETVTVRSVLEDP